MNVKVFYGEDKEKRGKIRKLIGDVSCAAHPRSTAIFPTLEMFIWLVSFFVSATISL